MDTSINIDLCGDRDCKLKVRIVLHGGIEGVAIMVIVGSINWKRLGDKLPCLKQTGWFYDNQATKTILPLDFFKGNNLL